MHKLFRQATGQEPESVWMSIAGAGAVFLFGFILLLAA